MDDHHIYIYTHTGMYIYIYSIIYIYTYHYLQSLCLAPRTCAIYQDISSFDHPTVLKFSLQCGSCGAGVWETAMDPWSFVQYGGVHGHLFEYRHSGNARDGFRGYGWDELYMEMCLTVVSGRLHQTKRGWNRVYVLMANDAIKSMKQS